MATEVLRFTHSGGNTSFYEDEFPEMNIDHIQKIDLFTKRTNKINLYETGYPYRIFSISFLLRRIAGEYTSTLSRIEGLYNKVDSYQQPEVMILYWRYRELALTEYCKVQMWRSDFKKLYVIGETRLDVLQIRFVETISTHVNVSVENDIVVSVKKSNVSDEIIVGIEEV